MLTVPDELRERLRRYGQEHVLTWWPELDDGQRRDLLEQLHALDLEQLRGLYAERDKAYTLPPQESIAPVTVTRLDEADRRLREVGEGALRRGDVAALVVAGGQGSRLGFDLPKGMYPISPVRKKTLYRIYAEKLLALSRRYGRAAPLLVMTSPATHEETVRYFGEQRFFGLPSEQMTFFTQGTMPALDLATGRLLMESRGRLFLSPNGHGGTLRALADGGQLRLLTENGIRHVFYFQVDNPLTAVADPLFLGHHIAERSEVSTRAVPKQSAADRLGNLVLIDGRCGIIEYSDLPESLARQTDEQGRLRFGAGNSAIHIFDVGFLERALARAEALPFHLARKKVPCLDERGEPFEPKWENALKFEMFIFDVLPLAERWAVVETGPGEFNPLKNATGADSPATVVRAMSNQAADWLEAAGVRVPRNDDGDAAVPLEISPLFALDADELAAKVDRNLRLDGPTYLG